MKNLEVLRLRKNGAFPEVGPAKNENGRKSDKDENLVNEYGGDMFEKLLVRMKCSISDCKSKRWYGDSKKIERM